MLSRTALSGSVALLFAGPVLALEVRIVDPAGQPVPGATVICVDPAGDAVYLEEKSVATLPDPCRQVFCDLGGSLPGKAWPASGAASAACVVTPGVKISGELLGKCPAPHCEARLVNPEGKPVAFEWVSEGAPFHAGPHFAFLAQKLGRYRLQIAIPDPAEGDPRRISWSCTTDLGDVAPGTIKLSVPWRGPADGPGEIVKDGRTWTCGPPAAPVTAR